MNIQMNTPTQQLIQELDAAKCPEVWVDVAHRIAQIGEPAVPELLRYVISPSINITRGRRYMVNKVLLFMGYPANRSAIHFMVSQVSWSNSPGWDDTLETLINIGEPVIPAVRQALRFYRRDLYEYSIEIQGLCVLLENLDVPVIEPLVPDLLQLLEAGTDVNHADEYVLWPLRKIGSPRADAAIPILGKIIASQRREHTRKVAIEALKDFDPDAVRPLVPILKRCMGGESERLRESARKILAGLGEAE
jgi:hypothetical protein